MRALLSIAAMSLILAACGPQAPGSVETAPEAVPEPVKSQAVVGPILITFSEMGAGEINGATPLDVELVRSYFPDAEVRQETAGGPDIITIRRPDGLVVDLHPGINPELIGRILGRAGPVVGPLGEELGSGWVAMGFTPDLCMRGQDPSAPTLICYRPGEPRLGYVFDLSGFEGPSGVAPSATFLEARAKLSAFVWTAA